MMNDYSWIWGMGGLGILALGVIVVYVFFLYQKRKR